MKKIISILLLFTMNFTFSVPVLAANETTYSDSSSVISFETYYDSVRSEYAKYGVGYEVIEKNDDFVFTQQILDDKLAEIRKTMQNTTVSYNVNYNPQSVADSLEVFNEAAVESHDNSAIIRNYMPVNKTYQYSKYLECPAAPGLAWAYICMEVNAKIDIQYNDIMSILSYSSFQKGAYLNFVSWTQRSMKVTPNYTDDYITATVTGLLTVEYTEPNTNLLVGYTSEHTFSHTFYVK